MCENVEECILVIRNSLVFFFLFVVYSNSFDYFEQNLKEYVFLINYYCHFVAEPKKNPIRNMTFLFE